MKVSKYINPNIIQDGSIDGDKKIKDYPPLKKGSGKNSVCKDSCTATGDYSHAEGFESTASGLESHAEGAETNATEYTAHAEGYHTTASAPYSHSEGSVTEAFGYSAHAEGSLTTASGRYSHAEGSLTYASGYASHAEGQKTIASNKTEHAEGKYNISIPNKTIHTIGIGGGTSNTDRKNAHEIHLDGKHYIYGIGGYDGTNSQIEGIKTVQEVVAEAANTVRITYTDLKLLRDGGTLVPGQQYRVTDYNCTTTQANTKSAGHVFDIIVTADDASTLNEVTRAVKHEFDDPAQDYFKDCNLSAWKIWYCLDNDTTRFAWADATNGKGVIYRMIDEWNNDCPYDFKNIQFKHPNNTTTYPYYYYTFASSNIEANTDYSLSITNKCYSNTIRKCIISNKRKLNCIIFIGSCCHGNSFGNNCDNNSFGNGCYFNSFGSGCYSNSFGDGCEYNSFGNGCGYNSLGNDCRYNSFGIFCVNIMLASDASASTKYSYYNNNHFGDGCQYIVFTGAETASSSAQVQNYNFAQGLKGTSNAYLTIEGVRNRSFETKVAKKSNGELKIYCDADLIM